MGMCAMALPVLRSAFAQFTKQVYGSSLCNPYCCLCNSIMASKDKVVSSIPVRILKMLVAVHERGVSHAVSCVSVCVCVFLPTYNLVSNIITFNNYDNETFYFQGQEICRVFCGAQFSLALSKSGALFTWGKGDNHRLGHNSEEHVRYPKQVKGLTGEKTLSFLVLGQN